MKHVRLVGVCLVVASICAVQAAAASAEPDRIPGSGSCYAVLQGTGTFVEGGCEEYGEPKGYEWCWNDQEWPNPCPRNVNPFVGWESAKVSFATANKLEVRCTKLTGAGTYTELGITAFEAVALSGCASRGTSCQSAEAGAGDIDTGAIEGNLGFVDAADHDVGLELSSSAGALLEFSCGGTSFAVRGSVIGTVPANKPEAKLPITFKAKKGKQIPGGFEEGSPAKLEVSVSDGPYEALGLTAKIKQIGETKKTKTEIRCKNRETEAVEAC